LLVLGAVAALLVAGGVTTWWLFERSTTHATTIPASFDGRWTGHGPAGDNSDVEFTASLTKVLEVGQLACSGLTCYRGPLTVSDATEDRLTMRFEGGTPADECNSWDVVFVRLPGGDLRMKVDSDSQNYPEGKFEIRMSRSD
jgi:hypothetical protein